jgi:hypothetical protein
MPCTLRKSDDVGQGQHRTRDLSPLPNARCDSLPRKTPINVRFSAGKFWHWACTTEPKNEMSHTLPTLCCAALLLAATPAAARGAAADNRSGRAEALSQRAQALLDAGRIDEACAKFEASETLADNLGTLLKLGDCYERAGRTASAWHTFLEAQAVAQNQKDTEREQVATFRVAVVEPKLTRVMLIVPMTSRVPGLVVRLGANAIPPSAWGSAIPVDPGTERVSASAKGYSTWSFDLDSSQAQGRKLHVNVPALNPMTVANHDRQNA